MKRRTSGGSSVELIRIDAVMRHRVAGPAATVAVAPTAWGLPCPRSAPAAPESAHARRRRRRAAPVPGLVARARFPAGTRAARRRLVLAATGAPHAHGTTARDP